MKVESKDFDTKYYNMPMYSRFLILLGYAHNSSVVWFGRYTIDNSGRMRIGLKASLSGFDTHIDTSFCWKPR